MSDDLRCRGLFANLTARLRCASFAELQLIDRALETLEGVRERDAYGRRWERRIATGPGDVDRCWHLVARSHTGVRRHIATTACSGSWMRDDPTETVDSPPLEERCTACWREAVQGNALGLALIEAVDEIAARERALDEAREVARDEVVPRDATTSGGLGGPYLLEMLDPPVIATAIANGCDEAVREFRDHERRASAGTVHIGLPGDDMSDRVVVEVDPPGFDPAREFAVDQNLTRLDPTPAVIALCEQPRDQGEDLELEWDVSDIHAGEGR